MARPRSYWGFHEKNVINSTDFRLVEVALVSTLIEDYLSARNSEGGQENHKLHGVIVIPAIGDTTKDDSLGLRGVYSEVECTVPFGSVGTLARNLQEISTKLDGAVAVKGNEIVAFQVRLNNTIGSLVNETNRSYPGVDSRPSLYDFYLNGSGETTGVSIVELIGGNGEIEKKIVRVDGGMRTDGALSYALTATIPLDERHRYDRALIERALNPEKWEREGKRAYPQSVRNAIDSECPVMMLSQTTAQGGRGGRFAKYGPNGVEKRIFFDEEGRLIERIYAFNPLSDGVYIREERELDVKATMALCDKKEVGYNLPGKQAITRKRFP